MFVGVTVVLVITTEHADQGKVKVETNFFSLYQFLFLLTVIPRLLKSLFHDVH